MADVKVARRLITRPAKGILRCVGIPAANAVIVDRMRPHVIRGELEAALERSANVKLQRVEGAVTHVAAPRNHTKCRVRRHSSQWTDQVRVGCGQDIRSFVADIARGSQDVKRQLLLNRRGPCRHVVVFPIAIQIARGNHAQASGLRVLYY